MNREDEGPKANKICEPMSGENATGPYASVSDPIDS